MRQRLGVVAVDLDPEHVVGRDRAEDFQVPLGLGVEIEVEKDVHVRPRAVAKGFEVGAEVAQHLLLDIELRIKGPGKAGDPAGRGVAFIDKSVGLQRRKTLVARLRAERPDAVEIGDRRRIEFRAADPPGAAMRPVDPDAVAHLAAEQHVARDAERLGLGVEQRVLDRTQPLGDHTARGRTGRGVQLGIDALVVERALPDHARGAALDHRRHAGRPEPLVKLAPPDDAVSGADLEEVVVAPPRIGAQHGEAGDFHGGAPDDYGWSELSMANLNRGRDARGPNFPYAAARIAAAFTSLPTVASYLPKFCSKSRVSPRAVVS